MPPSPPSSLLICTAAVKQEFHLEEENFFTEDEYVEEEEEEDDEDEDEVSSSEKGLNKKCRGRANGEPRMKMRRIFRITHGRERQRGDQSSLCSYLETFQDKVSLRLVHPQSKTPTES